jgi:hypothetical protein
MPCDTIQESTVELKNPNIKLLMDALTSLGLNPRHNAVNGRISFTNGRFENGQITLRSRSYEDNPLTADAIKVAYSQQIVGYAAKQFGWKVEDVTAKTPAKRGVMATFRVKK